VTDCQRDISLVGLVWWTLFYDDGPSIIAENEAVNDFLVH
jgi:hypothetical protein